MYDKQFKFNEDGEFRILLFGDPHEKDDFDSKEGRAKRADTLKFHETAFKALKPDLAVYMGDICSIPSGDADMEPVVRQLKGLVAPAVERGIPFATVMGNHDHDAQREEELTEILVNTEYCVTRRGDKDITGYSNYYIPICGKSGKPEFNLWFMDSNNTFYDTDISAYDIIHRDQIDWYEQTSAKLRKENKGAPLPALLFQHIPVLEEYELMRKAKPWEMWKAVRGYGHLSKNWYVLKDKDNGYLAEGPCPPDVNSGQFESWKKMGDVKGAFFGHDHMNNIAGEVDGILLAQCKTSGFWAYTDGGRPSVRLVTVHEDGSFETSVHSFKDFALECTCLGPIKKRITDRQSVNATIAAYALGIGAITAAVMLGAGKACQSFKNRRK